MPNKTTTLDLCDKSDYMKVTTLSAQAVEDDKITIIATKEIFILTYEVEHKTTPPLAMPTDNIENLASFTVMTGDQDISMAEIL
jgi:Holliday junction resolvase